MSVPNTLRGESHKPKKKRLPVYIVEDHNDALQWIYRGIGAKQLPVLNGTIVHLDSHPDLMVPEEMPADDVWDRQDLFESLSIGTWIMPAVYAGHFSRIIWIKPEWADQIPDGVYEFYIGENKETKTIRCTLKEMYFVSEGMYSSVEDLDNVRKAELQVLTFSGGKCSGELKVDSPFTLDIDLDFFSTQNPFLELYKKADLFNQLKDLYAYEPPTDTSDAAIEACVEKRRQKISTLKKLFGYVGEHGCLDSTEDKVDPEIVKKVNDIVKSLLQHYSKDEIDWDLVHDAGCTCDAGSLPHHVSTLDDIGVSMTEVEQFFRELPLPGVITVARSSEDEYCPLDQIDTIQKSFVTLLGKVYDNVNIQEKYHET